MKNRLAWRGSAVVAATLLPLTMAACGANGDANAGNGDGGGSGDRPKVIAVMANVTDPYFITMQCGAQEAANRLDIDLEWTGATNADVQTQLRNTQTAVLQQPDAIMQTPFDPNAFVEPVRQMMQQGITYLMVDGALSEDVAWKYIVTEHEGLESIVGDPIAEAMGDTGKIGIIASSPDNTIDRIRWESWSETFPTEHPDIEVLEPQYVESETAAAASAAAGLINGNPDLTAIFATNGPELSGVASAVLAAGKEGQIQVIGYAAGVPEDLELIRSGVVTGFFVQAPYVEGQKAIEMLAEWFESREGESGPIPGGEEPYEHNTPLFYINADNIDDEETQPYYGLTSADGPTCG